MAAPFSGLPAFTGPSLATLRLSFFNGDGIIPDTANGYAVKRGRYGEDRGRHCRGSRPRGKRRGAAALGDTRSARALGHGPRHRWLSARRAGVVLPLQLHAF